MSSLTERAMLSTLHIRSWSGLKVDREVTDATNADFKAEKEAGNYNKRLVKSSFFSGVSSAHNNMKRTHRLLTLPWEDNGTRILSNAGYVAYTQKMKEAKVQVEKEVKLFLADPDPYVREAKVRLGDMFKIEDYPSPEELEAKFGVDVEIKPVPESKDFRVKLSDDSVKAVVKDIERRTKERMEQAVNDIFQRVEGVVKHMTQKLRDYQPSADGRAITGSIRDNIVFNVQELVDIIPILNISDDPRIDKLVAQLRGELVDPYSPEDLRADSNKRKQAITKAEAILKKVQGYVA